MMALEQKSKLVTGSTIQFNVSSLRLDLKDLYLCRVQRYTDTRFIRGGWGLFGRHNRHR